MPMVSGQVNSTSPIIQMRCGTCHWWSKGVLYTEEMYGTTGWGDCDGLHSGSLMANSLEDFYCPCWRLRVPERGQRDA